MNWKSLENRIEQLDKLVDQTKIEELTADIRFIQKHITTAFALDIFDQDLWSYAGSFYLDSFTAIYKRLPIELQSSDKGKKVAQSLKNFKQSSVGSFSPDIKVSDISGKEISLSSYRGKFVLIDFWASWCGPCRQDFPTVKYLYSKYHSVGFEVISISRDEDIQAWKKAIEKDRTANFHHISTKLNSDAALLEQFFAWAIPVKILVDREGKIIGRWRGGGDANKQSMIKAVEELAMQ